MKSKRISLNIIESKIYTNFYEYMSEKTIDVRETPLDSCDD